MAAGQSRSDLESRRQQLLKEIKATESEIAETKRNKEATLDRYLALKSQIQKRQALINTLRQEIDYANASIERTEEVLGALERDIERLKEEYAHTIRIAYRHKLSNSMLLFLFSADSFNEAFRRWQYIRQYDRFRKKQARNIIETQDMLSRKSQQLAVRKQEKEALLSSQEQQAQKMSSELKDKNRILKKLKTSESRLLAELNKQQKAHESLNKQIEDIIVAEMSRKRREARTNASPSSGASSGARERVAAERRLSSEFSDNRGRLPWPVRSGRISKPFGKVIELEDTGLKLPNNGIEISTESGSKVYPVFKGKVTHITFVPIYQNAILVNHGDFFTLYYRIEDVLVKEGEEVGPEKAIGQLAGDGKTLHFEIWEGTRKLNPAHWIAKR
jgi:septal ring factor EnvC (AmiA/AmiB activator)